MPGQPNSQAFNLRSLIPTNLLASWKEMAAPSSIFTNLSSGVTVACVALPLNVALAIACGLPPHLGLISGVAAGLIGGFFGGARLQITGPEVALMPLTFEIIQRHGITGLIAATMLAGLLQIALGFAKVGRLIHAIPVSVVGGFMSAVGLLVLNSQIPRLLGLPPSYRLVSQLRGTEWLHYLDTTALLIGLGVIVALILLPKLDRRIPAALLALALVVVICHAFQLNPPNVGKLKAEIPTISMPSWSKINLVALFPEALALALLASIDSLLAALSIDARSKTPRHSPDQELIAQGAANLLSASFGGMPVAGAIVRSMAALQSGASTRLAPITQSVTLAVMLFALGSLVAMIPMAGLAGILLVVGWNLINWRELLAIWKVSRFEAFIFIATAASILFFDFTDGVLMGLILSLTHFAHEQRLLDVALQHPTQDEIGELEHLLPSSTAQPLADKPIAVVRVEGPIFFASHSSLDTICLSAKKCKYLILDLAGVPMIDVTGIASLRALIDKLRDNGTHVAIARSSEEVQNRLLRADLLPHLAGNKLFPTVQSAYGKLHEQLNYQTKEQASPQVSPSQTALATEGV
jgi:sulfate permease, SulP family